MKMNSDFWRSVVLLGGSFAAIAEGTMLAPQGTVNTALDLIQVGGGVALANLGANLAASLTYDGAKSGSEQVRRWLRGHGAGEARFPPNHDVARAVARAHVNAVRFVIESLRADLDRDKGAEYDCGALIPFCEAASKWIRSRLAEINSSDFLSSAPIDSALKEVEALIEGKFRVAAADGMQALRADAVHAALRDLAKGSGAEEIPVAVSDRFLGHGDNVGWVVAAYAFFAEELKSNVRVRTAVFGDLLNRAAFGVTEANVQLEIVLEKFRSQDEQLAERFRRLDKEIAKLAERKVSIDDESLERLRTALVGALAQTNFVDALRRRIVLEAPPDVWAAEPARVAVRKRIAMLSETFYGRQRELQELDALVDERSRGLIVVTAPAGFGKSALLAKWLDRRIKVGDIVVRHFVSTNFEYSRIPRTSENRLTESARSTPLIG